MRLLDLKGKVWSALVGLVVIAAITLLGLMMVPKQGKKMGLGLGLYEACGGQTYCLCPKTLPDECNETGASKKWTRNNCYRTELYDNKCKGTCDCKNKYNTVVEKYCVDRAGD